MTTGGESVDYSLSVVGRRWNFLKVYNAPLLLGEETDDSSLCRKTLSSIIVIRKADIIIYSLSVILETIWKWRVVRTTDHRCSSASLYWEEVELIVVGATL